MARKTSAWCSLWNASAVRSGTRLIASPSSSRAPSRPASYARLAGMVRISRICGLPLLGVVFAGKYLLEVRCVHQPAEIATCECAGFAGQKTAVGHEGKVPVKPRDTILRGLCQPLADALPALVLCRQHPAPARAHGLAVFASSEQRTSHVRQLWQGFFVAVDQLVKRARRNAIIGFVIGRFRRSRQRSFSFFFI